MADRHFPRSSTPRRRRFRAAINPFSRRKRHGRRKRDRVDVFDGIECGCCLSEVFAVTVVLAAGGWRVARRGRRRR